MGEISVFEGRVKLYRRSGSQYWQARARLHASVYRKTTGEMSLDLAKHIAEEWYLDLRSGVSCTDRKETVDFRRVANIFAQEWGAQANKNRHYIETTLGKLRNYIIPYMGSFDISDINTALIDKYRQYRIQAECAPARSTLDKEIVVIRQVLDVARRRGWIEGVPETTSPFRDNSRLVRRAMFDEKAVYRLFHAMDERIKNPRKRLYQYQAKQLFDYCLLILCTGLRPDEANRLQYRDCAIRGGLLDIDVRGKRGVGRCISLPMAVSVYHRMVSRNSPHPEDVMFPIFSKRMFRTILLQHGLQFDRDGQRRTVYSLRHSYISFRLKAGADIYEVAKNCRTSVQMIEKYYAAHIVNERNISAINR